MANHFVRLDAVDTAVDLMNKYDSKGPEDPRVYNNLTIVNNYLHHEDKAKESLQLFKETLHKGDSEDPTYIYNQAVLDLKEVEKNY